MPNLAFTPTPILDEQKKTNELMHNQPAQKVFPYQADPNQVLPYVPQQQNNMGLQTAPLQPPEGTTAPAAPALAPPEYKAPTFDASQVAAVAAQQPPPPPAPSAAPIAALEQVGALPPPPVAPGDVQAVPSGYQPGDLQQQVLEEGQRTVLEGYESPVTDLTSLLTQQMLKDPSFGRDFEETMRRRMAGYDVEAAQAFEKSRQATAPISQTGANIEDLQMLALAQGQGRAEFGTELEEQEYNRMLQDRLEILGAGREASEMERQRFETDVGAIAQMTGAAEGTEQRSFEAQENAINRGMEFALQTNNENFQFAITELQGKIEQGIELTKQDFISTQNELDRELSEAMQSDDIAARAAAIQMQLDFDKWQTEAGFEFTEEQNALNRGFELSLQTGDQVFQEKMLNLKSQIDLNLMTTDQQWQGIQNDLDRDIQKAIAEGNWNHAIDLQNMKQEFQGAQNTQQQFHETTMQTMAFEQDKWKQGEVEKLTKLGWSHEDAAQQSEQTHQKYMQDFEWKKKELMQQGIQEHEAEQLAAEYGYKEKMQSLEHIFQSQIEANKITLEESKLAQQASQFTSELDFQKWVKEQDIDLEMVQMAWKTSENVIAMAHEKEMQSLEQIFQSEVEANKITLEESKLAQQASQFTSELEFQEWAKEQDVDLEIA